MTLRHGDRCVLLKSRVYAGSRLPDEVWNLVDTRGNATPGFLVFGVVTSEVTHQPTAGSTPSTGGRHAGTPTGYQLLTPTLGRGCFADDGAVPARMRVSSFETYEWSRITDKAPRWRHYGRWTPAG